MEDRGLEVRGTGHQADKLGRYIGTVQLDNGMLVFHYFETK